MEAVVALSNLAENPATHAKAFAGDENPNPNPSPNPSPNPNPNPNQAFAGDEGAAAFGLFVELLRY